MENKSLALLNFDYLCTLHFYKSIYIGLPSLTVQRISMCYFENTYGVFFALQFNFSLLAAFMIILTY